MRTFIEIDTGLRCRIEFTVEALIDLLDQLDGDPDAEPDDEGEPLEETFWAHP